MKAWIFVSVILGTLIGCIAAVVAVALLGPERRRHAVRANLRKRGWVGQLIGFLLVGAAPLSFVFLDDEEFPRPLWLGVVIWIAVLAVALGVGVLIHGVRDTDGS